MALPPSDVGADQVSLTLPGRPGTALSPIGAPGTVGPAAAGVADTSVDGAPVPIALIALTVKKYWVPLVSPLELNDAVAAVRGDGLTGVADSPPAVVPRYTL